MGSLRFKVGEAAGTHCYLTLNDQTIGGQDYANAQTGRPREWAIGIKKKF